MRRNFNKKDTRISYDFNYEHHIEKKSIVQKRKGDMNK